MIVEQRIGRIQRLASKHAKVGVFNIILRGTFEEYIVGRLMEKLQMASHAIGDLEALLQASGVDGDDENVSFDERIRQLVVASLAGKDVELETRQAEASIEKAQSELEHEQATIAELLGDPGGKEYVGPRAPTLPGVIRSMKPREFTLLALATLGAQVSESSAGVVVEDNGGEESIHFEGDTPAHPRSTLYAPGTPAFARLVNRIVATGIHSVCDLDDDPMDTSKELAADWVGQFRSCLFSGIDVREVRRRFRGTALVRVRATVAHDGYERLVQVPCSERHHNTESSRSFLARLSSTLDDPRALGLDIARLSAETQLDDAIGEFCRFYLERREVEMKAAGGDERKRKKLEDEFTPRLEMSLVGLDGELYRDITVQAKYKIDDVEYASLLTVTPHAREIIDEPAVGRCAKTNLVVPQTCLKECEISRARVLDHLLVRSEASSRAALPEHIVVCGLSNKRLLQDEVELSGVTGKLVNKNLLKTSVLSSIRAEPEYFAQCEFSGAQVLRSELAVSEISGKRYRQDQQRRSVVSGRTGHEDEFVVCSQTNQSLALSEAERCEVTGSYVKPGILEECAITHKCVLPTELDLCELTGKRVLRSELETCQASGKRVLRTELTRCDVSGKRVLRSALETCAVTGKHVLPSELERCSVTRKRAIKSVLVTSSIGGMRLLEEAAVRSSIGEFCAPAEAGQCVWSARKYHPSDLRTCRLTGLPILFSYAVGSLEDGFALQPLFELLQGIRRNADKEELWPTIAARTAAALGGGRCQVEGAILSPTGMHLAVSVEVRTMLGFKVQQAAVLYATGEKSLLGRVTRGQRKSGVWARV
jgi:hypothetical protein